MNYADDEEYFNDDDSIICSSNASNNRKPLVINDTVDDVVDPLDAFMSSMDENLAKESSISISNGQEIVSNAEDDYTDSYADLLPLSSVAAKAAACDTSYDSDGNMITTSSAHPKKKIVEPLPTIDHSLVHYKPFNKCFYREHNEISSLTISDTNELRRTYEISVTGNDLIKPVKDMHQLNLNRKLYDSIIKYGYTKLTAIQCQAIPIILSGRDFIGIAKTGSGKTFSFLWPSIIHVLDQPQTVKGDGCIVLILAPTHELVIQIYNEAKKFTNLFNIRIAAIYGGESKWENEKLLRDTVPEIIVATPGRYIDMIKSKMTNLTRCTMVILDEADRMFEMGFEYQVRSIVNNIRSDRQTVLFSATMKKKIEAFAREILIDPIKCCIGNINSANINIKQVVCIVANQQCKLQWIYDNTDDFVADGKVLIFVDSRINADALTEELTSCFATRQLYIKVDCLHAGKDQHDRSQVIKRFRGNDSTKVLVATDIACRGLDIKDVNTVINYNIANNIETHIHRIGRTSRMSVDGGSTGVAYTLLTHDDAAFANDLVKHLTASDQMVTESLLNLAAHAPKHQYHKGTSSSSNGTKGRAAGIGTNDAPIAMTSAMMAANTSNSNGNISIRRTSSNCSKDMKAATNHCNSSSSSSNSSSTTNMRGDIGHVLRGFVRSAIPPPPVQQPVPPSVPSSVPTSVPTPVPTPMSPLVSAAGQSCSDTGVYTKPYKKSRWE